MHQTFFSIENWDGWAPGLTKNQDWILWAKNEKSIKKITTSKLLFKILFFFKKTIE